MEQLLAERRKYETELRQITARIRELDAKINDMKTRIYPECSSCGRPRSGWIATQKDIDDYTDQMEGYGGPTEGQ